MTCRRLIAAALPLALATVDVGAHPGHDHTVADAQTPRPPSRTVTAPAARAPRGVEIPFSVQMHVHGSLSEGSGSMDSQTDNAAATGTDVIWWTDHDWRITGYKYTSRFAFDDWSEPVDALENWSVTDNREAGVKAVEQAAPFTTATAVATFVTDPAPHQGSASLRLSAQGPPGAAPGEAAWRLDASRRRFTRSLAADVHCHIALLPVTTGPDAWPFLRFTLSQHAPNSQLPFEQYVLEYTLDPSVTAPFRTGPVYTVPLAPAPGAWNEFDLDLTADALAGFPFIDATDNSIYDITFGIRARHGAVATCHLDDLRFTQGAGGDELFAWQRSRMQDLAALQPAVTQHQGLEISYYEHLNVYGDAVPFVDYAELIAASGYANPQGWVENARALTIFSARWTVQRAHEVGALVSYNHAFGTSNELLPIPDPVEQRDLLVQTRVWGADIIEIGYRQRGLDLNAFLWLWDELLLNAVPILGNGVSDTHGGNADNWRTTPNNFVTWILAPSAAHADLLEALRRGRAFFGDLTLFDGHADHTTPEGWRMGQVIITDRPSLDIDTTFHGLAPSDTVRIITDGAVASTHSTTGADFTNTTTLTIPPTAPASFLRAEVYDSKGVAKVFTNPVIALRQLPPEGLTHHRAAFDLRGYRSLTLDHLRLIDLCIADAGDDTRLDIVLEAPGGGSVVIDASARGHLPATLSLAGITATIASDPDALTITLTDLTGAGTITLDDGLPRCAGDANCDGLVNFHDLELVLNQWGRPTPSGYAGDITRDGVVDFADLNEVLGGWGNVCP